MHAADYPVMHGRVGRAGPKRVHPAIRLLGLLSAAPDDPDLCWVTTSNSRRPTIGIGKHGRARCARVVLEAKLGRDLGPGMFALHTCDNPACVRPEHLFEGTHQDNMRDMASKCRGNTAKLTPEHRDEVCRLAREGWLKVDIARAYGITTSTLWAARKKESHGNH